MMLSKLIKFFFPTFGSEPKPVRETPTFTKAPPKKRGRPKGSKNKKK